MSFRPVGSILIPGELVNRKKFPDIGVLACSYALKIKAYSTSRNILRAVEDYLESTRRNGSYPCACYAEVDENKFFYLDKLYFVVQLPDNKKFEVMIDLKQSFVYQVLKNSLFDSCISISKLIDCYQVYWENALDYAIILNNLQ